MSCRSVWKMSEIKTAFGYTRAFVRLALEKKLLSRHLKELLSNHELLRQVLMCKHVNNVNTNFVYFLPGRCLIWSTPKITWNKALDRDLRSLHLNKDAALIYNTL